jgi:hypothetical protein
VCIDPRAPKAVHHAYRRQRNNPNDYAANAKRKASRGVGAVMRGGAAGGG